MPLGNLPQNQILVGPPVANKKQIQITLLVREMWGITHVGGDWQTREVLVQELQLT